MIDGKGAGNGLGDDLHVQLQGIELLERDLQGPPHGPDHEFLVEDHILPAGNLEVQGADDIDEIGKSAVKPATVTLAAATVLLEEFLPLLPLLENDKLLLFAAEQTLADKDVKKGVGVVECHGLVAKSCELNPALFRAGDSTKSAA